MSFVHELRVAVWPMRKRPLFTLAIVLTLAICIGAVTTVFSVIDAALLRPLPYPEPERIGQLVLRLAYKGQNGMQQIQDGRTWFQFRNSVRSMDLTAYSDETRDVSFSAGNRIQYVSEQRVGAGYFRVFGVPPFLGREFARNEDVPNGPNLAIISHRLWQRVFGGNQSVIGRTITTAGQTYQLVGVASKQFESAADLWIPLRPSTGGEGRGKNYTVVGRLRKGISRLQADAEVASIGRNIIDRSGVPPGFDGQFGLADLKLAANEEYIDPSWISLAATLLVLFIGCVNVAGMLMAQGISRTQEIATRMALGASRGAIVKQLMSESLLLAISGGIAGVFAAWFSLDLMKAMMPDPSFFISGARLDYRVLAAAGSISLMTSVLFGLFPALHAGRVDIITAQRGGGAVTGKLTFRRILSVAQIAVAVTLLIGSGLLLRSLHYLWNVRPGVNAENVSTAAFILRDARYATPEEVDRYYQAVLVRLQSIPGVESAAVTLSLPYELALNQVFHLPEDNETRVTNVSYVSPQFLDVFRIPVLRGRGIIDSDIGRSSRVVLVNNAFARRYFKKEDPIGARLRFGDDRVQVVGVVGDVLQRARWGGFRSIAPVPAVYFPSTQFKSDSPVHTWFSPSWVVRTTRPIAGIQLRIEEAAKSVDPTIPITGFRSIDQLKVEALGRNRFMALLLGIAAGIALLLASIGIYAMISNSVAQRTREFGIEMALGATANQILRDSIRPGLLAAGMGLALGLALAQAVAPVLRSMLFGIKLDDPVTRVVVVFTISAVAAAASCIAALKIIKLDPSEVLRRK